MIDKLDADCTKNVDEVKIAEVTSTENVCVCSYTICVILSIIALAISIAIGAYFVYFHWYLKKICYSYYVWHTYSTELRSNNNFINAIPLNL